MDDFKIKRTLEFFPLNENRQLFVVKDQKIDSTLKKRVIICHGLTGDNIGPQRLLEKLSLKLCETFDDLEVVRFDFEGSGFSSSNFKNTSFNQMVENALSVALEDIPIICWMGLSTGALVALKASYLRQKKEPVIAMSNGLFTPSFTLSNDPISIRDGQLFLDPLFFEEKNSLDIKTLVENTKSYLKVILGEADLKHMKAKPLLDLHLVESFIIEKADHLFCDISSRFKLFNLIEHLTYEITQSHPLSYC